MKNWETDLDSFAAQIYWDLTSKRVLSMEFMEGFAIDNQAAISQSGLNPVEIGKLLSKVYAEAAFAPVCVCVCVFLPILAMRE